MSSPGEEIMTEWLKKIWKNNVLICEAAGLPACVKDGQYVGDAFTWEEHYTNIIENDTHEYKIWWNSELDGNIFGALNAWLYEQWHHGALIEENRLLMTAIVRISAIVIKDNTLSVLVSESWTINIVNKFEELTAASKVKKTVIGDLGTMYTVKIPDVYLNDNS